VARGLRQRPVLPPAGHAAVDEPGIASGAIGGPEPKALHHARPVALDQRIRRLDHRQRLRNGFGALQVEGDDPLSSPQRTFGERAIGGAEGRLVRANDRDDFCAEIGQHAAGERAWTDPLELDRLKSGKRTHHP